METELKILFVEDYLADAELAQQVLLKEGITFQSRVVENEVDFINELENFVPDIIISDFALPKFDAMKVLKITLDRKPEIPVILLTGSIDEATAVECIKTGAMDYVFKSHLSRLPFSIKEAIEKKKALAEKEKAVADLKKSEEQYRLFVQNFHGIAFCWMINFNPIFFHGAVEEITGYTENEFLTGKLTWKNMIHPDDLVIFYSEDEKKLHNAPNFSFEREYRIIRKDLQIRWVHEFIQSFADDTDMSNKLRGVIYDITERKHAEERLYKLNRELRAISICNKVLLNAVDEQTLLDEICRIICQDAGYRLAWVGYAENDEAKTIRPVAWAGFDSGYIANAKLNWSEDSKHGKGPAGTAIRSGEAIYVQDFLTDPLMVPWRESAIQHGYRSGIAIPLKDEAMKVFGVLLIYSAEVGVMKPEEVWLLQELTSDLSFGIMNLRMRAKHKVAQELLQASEECFSTTFHFSPIAIAIYRPSDGRIVDVNDVFVETIGYPREEIIGHTTDDLNLYANPEDRIRIGQVLRKRGSLENFEFGIRKKSGEIRIVLNSARLINIGGENHYLSSIIDITERKKIEELLLTASRYTRSLIEASLDPLVTINPAGKITDVNEATEIVTGVLREELIGEDFTNYFTEPDKAKAGYQKVLAEGLVRDYPLTIQHSSGRTTDVLYNATIYKNNAGQTEGVFAAARDITERKQAEKERNEHIRFLESMERINCDIKTSADVENMLGSVLNTTLSIFDCDRAWLVYPYDPDAPSFRVPVEVNKPEYPGANVLNIEIPMSPGESQNMREALESDAPVTYTAGTDKPIMTAEQFKVQSQMFISIYPKVGKPWIFGMHQCSYPRVWTVEEKQLFKEISRRVADAITSLLSFNKLQESEERFRRIAENARDVIYRMSLPDGIYEYVSPAALKVFGYKPEEFYDTSGLIKQIIHPDWQNYFEEQWTNLIKGEMPPTYEYQIIHKSGEARWMNQRNILVKDNNGNSIAIEAIVTDITNRKNVEETLKESERAKEILLEKFDEAQHIAMVGSWEWDLQTNRIWWSEETYAIFGVSQKGFVPSFEENSKFIHQDDLTLYKKLFEHSLQTGEPLDIELRLVTNDEISKYCQAKGKVIYNDSGVPIRFMGTIMDITERKHLEDSLKESEELHRITIEHLLDPVFITDDDGKFTFICPNVQHILGYSTEEINLVGNISMFIGENLLDLNKLDSLGQLSNIETVIISKNGKKSYYLLTARRVSIKGGTILYVFRDITERIFNEELLQHERTLLRTVIDNLPDAIYAKDINGCKILANRADLDNIGAKNEAEVLNKTDFDVFPNDVAAKFFADDLVVIQTGQPVINREEFFIKDGGEKHWLLTSKLPLKDKSGTITGLVGIGRDITKHKKAEDKSKTLSKAIEQNPASIVITDPDGIIEYVNPSFEKLSGYNSAEVIGKTPRILKSGYHTGEFYKNLWTTIKAGNDFRCEMKNRKKNGEFYWENAALSPITNEHGNISHFIAVKEDITEKKKIVEELIAAKEKAEEMSRLKSNFLANMSHELRTPLNGILGYADYLSSQLKDPELLETSMGIYDSGKRLSETLNFILDLSEAETENIEILAKDVDVTPLAKNTIISFSDEADKKNLQLETIIKAENIFIHIEERLFCRILHNILDNAIKYTKRGKITVEIGKEVIAGEEWFYCKITDTGIGIAKDKIDLVWDEFRQVSEGLARSYEGTGLGLTISKKAVELMQGVITVESELGIGSTFTIKFPVVTIIPKKEEDLKVQRIVPQVHSAVFQPGKEKTKTAELPLLLSIEDDFANRNVVKYFLKNICTIELVADGETALQLITEKKYDIILVDINLGEGMNGITVVKEILKMPQYANTPIIAVTAFAMEQDKTEFLKCGFTHYISKPFQRAELIGLITSLLKNKEIV